jgi:hypothetical protein
MKLSERLANITRNAAVSRLVLIRAFGSAYNAIVAMNSLTLSTVDKTKAMLSQDRVGIYRDIEMLAQAIDLRTIGVVHPPDGLYSLPKDVLQHPALMRLYLRASLCGGSYGSTRPNIRDYMKYLVCSKVSTDGVVNEERFMT